ncbi:MULTISPECIES: signal recognition particle-docking protein FtsY [Anaerococcus]|uniref:signal recognition particle-docking protein FtsY n=1 Tax=Anaerococcus TaxID=165779 RepID=UPI001AE4B2D7|nr:MULTISPECIES: signal recognition particle-docking protein FtsY [Anaerococcus]MBP2069751.1 fused signal recognition particle receptor [Anaerococcus nagyae]MDU2565566.1 signal recognition particle-docking protein FtsY [Anaerococcus sp.]
MFDFFKKKKKEDENKKEYLEETYQDDEAEEEWQVEDEYEEDFKPLEGGETLVFESSNADLEEEFSYDESEHNENLDSNHISTEDLTNSSDFNYEESNNYKKEEIYNQSYEESENKGFFGKLRDGLLKTRDQFSSQIKNLFTSNVKIDDEMYEELEDILISADIGMETTLAIVDSLRYEINERNIKDSDEIYPLLEEIMVRHLDRDNLDNDLNFRNNELAIILVIGVNGVGKTTTIGKLAYNLEKEGKSVMLAAADTFRAAAIEQLGEWADKANVEMIAHSEGADPSAVIFDAIKSAKNKDIDVLICDTAGRLHNKKNLMKELEKINKTIDSHAGSATRENLLVLDATTGQNAVNQLREFKNVTDITGLILTKLDGTAKGGIIFPLQYELNVPVKYIGLGEGIDNLEKFDSKSFVDAMF